MKLYKEKHAIANCVLACSDWEVLREVLRDALYYTNQELKRPKRKNARVKRTRLPSSRRRAIIELCKYNNLKVL